MSQKRKIIDLTHRTLNELKASKKESVIREFIASTLSHSSRNRSSISSPLHHGQGIDPVRPTASSSIVHDAEEAEHDGPPLAACVLILSNDGKILAVSRKHDPSDFGLPGGKVDPGETPLQAAGRELEEETGLKAISLNPVYTRDDEGSKCTTFAGKVEGEIDTDEAGVIRWVDPEVLLQGSFGDYNLGLLKHLGIL